MVKEGNKRITVVLDFARYQGLQELKKIFNVKNNAQIFKLLIDICIFNADLKNNRLNKEGDK